MILKMNGNSPDYTSVSSSILAMTDPRAQVRSTAEAYLQNLMEKDIQMFLTHIFTMIESKDAKISLMGLTYLRHILHSNRFRFPDIGFSLQKLYAETGNKGIAQVFNIFINKPQHMSYKRQFSRNIIHKLSMELSQCQVNEKMLQFIIAAFGYPIDNQQAKIGMGNVPNGFIGFVNNFSSFQPPNLTDPFLWVNALIAMANFSGVTPPMSFIYRNLTRMPPFRTFLNLAFLYSRVHYRMTNLEEVYNLILRSITLMANNLVLDEIYADGINCLQIFVMYIRILLGDGFRLTLDLDISNTGHFLISEHLKSKQTWMHFMKFFASVLQQYGVQSKEIVDISVQVIKIFSENIAHQPLEEYLRDFQKDYSTNEETIYYLLSAMPRFVCDMFGASNLIITKLSSLFTKQIKNISPAFIQFIKRYVKVYEYFPSAQIQVAIHRFAETICASQLLHVSTMEPFKLKAQGLVILCQMQKFCIDKSMEYKAQFCRDFFNQFMGLLFQMSQASLLQDSSEVVQILMEAIGELISLPLYSPILNSQLVSNLISAFGATNDSDQMHIFSHLVNFVKQTFYIESLTPLTFQIVYFCLHSRSDALKAQGCELALKMLYEINRHRSLEQCLQQIQMVKKCGILEHIYLMLSSGQDDALYSKILIELVIHESIYKDIVMMLQSLNKAADMKGYMWNFQKVWEALVIMWNVESDYTQKNGINEKINLIRAGNCEKMLQNLSVQEKDMYIKQLQKQLNKIYWTRIPDVKIVVELGSAAGKIIEGRVNQIL